MGGTGVWADLAFKSEFMGNIFLLVLLFVCATPVFKVLFEKVENKLPALYKVLCPVWVVAVMLVSFTLLVGQTYNPFLYFRF